MSLYENTTFCPVEQHDELLTCWEIHFLLSGLESVKTPLTWLSAKYLAMGPAAG